ncbi:RNA polymerase III transcription factor IIIC subunit-domain-containing protein [Auriculariales sp. MPI-PUGE-AT-0066]|nr:RNA polymerase III transcription factor IIIC subunit-domain-containing protein [Auriculariales sp. MPI-PUGE-AT-0066]
MAESSQDAEVAPSLPLPQTHFYSVEYPGYVSSAGLPRAIQTLDQRQLDSAFRKGGDALELRLRPEDPFAHPVRGDVCKTSTLLMPIADYQYAPDPRDRIVQMRHALDTMDVEAIKAFRFQTDKEREATVQAELDARRAASATVDPELLPQQKATNDTDDEIQTSKERDELIARTLGSIPPPLWHHAPIPLVYGYKPNPSSVVQTFVDASGTEKQRLVNRSRWKGYGPASVAFSDKDVPTKPPSIVEEARHLTNANLIAKVAKLLEQRPVWTRLAISNQLTSAEERELTNSKLVMPLTSYIFTDGPWRDTYIRFGYDPRLPENQSSAYLLQRLYFRNTAHEMRRSKLDVGARKNSGPGVIKELKKPRPTGEDSAQILSTSKSTLDSVEVKKRDTRSHIFDGLHLAGDSAVFQLIDIEDPMLKRLITDENALEDTVSERNGWYNETALARIKAVLRRKFFTMLETGRVVPDTECTDLLDAEVRPGGYINKNLIRPLRKGKHNMAKGALAPEDAAYQRLTAAIRERESGEHDEEEDGDEYMEVDSD